MLSTDSGLVSIWEPGRGDGVALGLGDCGCGAAAEVYFQQILENARGQLWSLTRNDCLVTFASLRPFHWGLCWDVFQSNFIFRMFIALF